MKTFRYSALIVAIWLVNLPNSFGQSKFFVSVTLDPIFTHTDFSTVAPYSSPNSTLTLAEYAAKTNGVDYSFGVMGRYNISPKWSASLGLWATHSLTSKTTISYNGIPTLMKYHYNHPFSNLYKVPLLFNYQTSLNKLSPYFSAGVTVDFRGITYIDLNGNGEYVGVTAGRSAVTLTPLVGAGLLYRLRPGLSLVVQPNFQYDVQSHLGTDYYHSYRVSLQTQLLWRF